VEGVAIKAHGRISVTRSHGRVRMSRRPHPPRDLDMAPLTLHLLLQGERSVAGPEMTVSAAAQLPDASPGLRGTIIPPRQGQDAEKGDQNEPRASPQSRPGLQCFLSASVSRSSCIAASQSAWRAPGDGPRSWSFEAAARARTMRSRRTPVASFNERVREWK
jgi:hypothetical protein